MATLGFKPERSTLILSTGADFILDLVPENDSWWPEGTVSHINLLSSAGSVIDTWTPAAVSEGVITYIVDADDADLIPDKSKFRLYIAYSEEEPQLDYLRYYGQVARKD